MLTETKSREEKITGLLKTFLPLYYHTLRVVVEGDFIYKSKNQINFTRTYYEKIKKNFHNGTGIKEKKKAIALLVKIATTFGLHIPDKEKIKVSHVSKSMEKSVKNSNQVC